MRAVLLRCYQAPGRSWASPGPTRAPPTKPAAAASHRRGPLCRRQRYAVPVRRDASRLDRARRTPTTTGQRLRQTSATSPAPASPMRSSRVILAGPTAADAKACPDNRTWWSRRTGRINTATDGDCRNRKHRTVPCAVQAVAVGTGNLDRGRSWWRRTAQSTGRRARLTGGTSGDEPVKSRSPQRHRAREPGGGGQRRSGRGPQRDGRQRTAVRRQQHASQQVGASQCSVVASPTALRAARPAATSSYRHSAPAPKFTDPSIPTPTWTWCGTAAMAPVRATRRHGPWRATRRRTSWRQSGDERLVRGYQGVGVGRSIEPTSPTPTGTGCDHAGRRMLGQRDDECRPTDGRRHRQRRPDRLRRMSAAKFDRLGRGTDSSPATSSTAPPQLQDLLGARTPCEDDTGSASATPTGCSSRSQSCWRTVRRASLSTDPVVADTDNDGKEDGE